MPHPAIFDLQVSQEDILVRQKHANGTSTLQNWSKAFRQYSHRQEPASVSNPIREDGTRAPSEYFINRIYFGQRSSPAETSINPGNWGWMISPTSQVNAWGELFGSSTPAAPSAVFGKTHPSGFALAVRQRAQVEFLNQLADASGKDSWELGIVAGEFRETCGMAADLASSLLAGVRSISRRVKKSPKQIAETLTNYGELGPKAALKQLGGTDTRVLELIVESWLVKQFGLDPLVSDLFNASVNLQAKIADPVVGAESFTTVIRGGASDKMEFRLHTGRASSNYLIGMDCYADFLNEVKVAYACKYRIPVKPTTSERLGFYNPAHLAAQLTRFSWMLDYVTNTSDWLRSTMAGANCQFIEGTKSVLSRTTGVGGVSEAQPGWTVVRDPMASGFVFSSDKFERTLVPITGVLPSFLPGVKNQLNVTKMANSVAALTTLVGARSRPGPPVIKY